MAKKNKTYTPAPQVPARQLERLSVILEVLAGSRTVSEGARQLQLSRNHFQSLLHRGLEGLVQAIDARPSGRPAKPEKLAQLESELARLRRENARLQDQVDTTGRVLQAASGLLQARIRPSARQVRVKRAPGNPNEGDPEPDARCRRKLEQVEQMRRVGVTAAMAASMAGVHASTIRRWRSRERRGEPLVRRRGQVARPIAQQHCRRAAELVRRLHGLVGADTLRHSVEGISRREAARVKAQTLTEMERERKGALIRVTVTTPGVMRGMDAMYLPTREGRLYALFSADAAVPYRTAVKTGPRYDAGLVARALEADIEANEAPLVYRMDRAAAHGAPAVRALLRAHGVLVLHGPPRCPRFYGQHERQNREHRTWAPDLALLPYERAEECLAEALLAVNRFWRRRTLGWRTAYEVWAERPRLDVDRNALREEVCERAARIGQELERGGKPADLAERLAIEQALQTRGFLRQEPGGWC